MTCGKPTAILPPWAVMSPILAAGIYPIITENEPTAIVSGGPTHVAISPTRAAGMNPIITVGHPTVIGPPTCGIGGVPGVTIGQTCMSEIRAAGGIFDPVVKVFTSSSHAMRYCHFVPLQLAKPRSL